MTAEEIDSVSDELDIGERAAIALAERMGADLLLIDESAGRAEARRRSLRVTGTLGVEATNFYVDESLFRSVFAKWLEE